MSEIQAPNWGGEIHNIPHSTPFNHGAMGQCHLCPGNPLQRTLINFINFINFIIVLYYIVLYCIYCVIINLVTKKKLLVNFFTNILIETRIKAL